MNNYNIKIKQVICQNSEQLCEGYQTNISTLII